MRKERGDGFTLIELLVVVAIIGLLAAMIVPLLSRAREKSRQAACMSNIRQVLLAFSLYVQDNEDFYPPSYYFTHAGEIGWDFATDDWWSTHRPGLLGRYLNGKVFECPSKFQVKSYDRPFTGYAYNASFVGGGYSVWNDQQDHPVKSSRITNPCDTVLVADSAIWSSFSNEMVGNNYLRAPGDPYYYGPNVHFRHNGMANVGYCDGHVQSVSKKHNVSPDEGTLGDLSHDASAYDLE